MKTTKGGRVMNPTDAYRKELRKRELKRNKKERKKVREVGILKKDPETLREQIQKLETMKAEGALDKARKHKKRQLEDTLNLVLKKRKEYEEKMQEKGEEPVMFSHLGPPRRRTTAEEEERAKHPKPEDSVYFHPTLNPTGAPPPGKPPMFKSSIGPRIPLTEASSSGTVSSSNDYSLSVPPPPPPPPLPQTVDTGPGDVSVIPSSLPLPPPPPMPPKPVASESGITLPTPPGPPAKEQNAIYPPIPLPSVLHHSTQPPPPGTNGTEREKGQSIKSDDPTLKEPIQGSSVLPPPPPPPGLPRKSANNLPDGAPSEADTKIPAEVKDFSKLIPPPPPPRPHAPLPGPPLTSTLQPDVLPPGISRIPPPPSDIRQQLLAPVIPGQPTPPGMMVPMIHRPPFGPPPGPPPMMRPPLPPGPPPVPQDDFGAAFVPQKPSYVKSAASTVVKRPLAQHTPELTAMVPASVRVRRESVAPKPKLKAVPPTMPSATRPAIASTAAKQEAVGSSSAAKPQSIDDSYTAFLEDMKALGALDS